MSIYDKTPAKILEEYESKCRMLEDAGLSHAKAKGLLEGLKKNENALLSVIAGKGEGSNASRMTEAYASEKYADWIKGYAAAVEEEATTKVRYNALQTKVEYLRSLLSFVRETEYKASRHET